MAAETMTEPEAGRKVTAASRSVTRLAIEGMTCGNCARHVTEALQGVPGVRSASVSLDAHEATVRWQAEVAPNEAAAVQAVEQEGFGAQVVALGEGGQAGHGI